MQNYERDVQQEQLEKTSTDAKVYHEKYFYFDYKGEEYRALWFTVGYSYAGLRIWKKVQCEFIIKYTTWNRAIDDALKHGSKKMVEDKRTFYNAVATYNLCVSALDETIHTIPHTKKIIR